ncbi:unnamed protein product [Taenia asiatica]|uniref:Uncharacterized protein n=1 Tax=Taenia asiatica TaxID=60517 RepID=A0A0R3WGW8_TAEAS|nr:unnamed protein product [Taenia asiatica]
MDAADLLHHALLTHADTVKTGHAKLRVTLFIATHGDLVSQPVMPIPVLSADILFSELDGHSDCGCTNDF